jgi:hypothetical protein
MVSVRARVIRLTPLVLSGLAVGHLAFAMETDQFTTPPAPLYDVGPRMSRKVVEILESGRPGDDPERVLFDWVGRNIFTSRFFRWVKQIQVADAPVTFLPNVFDSIYRVAFSPAPASFWFDSPTIHVHGYYMGTDKIDHFFQQGYEYFELVRKYEAEGAGSRAATATAVAHGVKQEHTYYGTAASGIFSNGDLAANFAGMKFYLNLCHSVRIGERELPALLVRTRDGWRLRPGVDPDRVLEPFLSNHLDESLNPSRYRFSRTSIRALVRSRCENWMRFYSDRLDLVAPSGRSFAATWFGEDYGHWLPPADEVSIATECDARNPRPTKRARRNTHSHAPPSS